MRKHLHLFFLSAFATLLPGVKAQAQEPFSQEDYIVNPELLKMTPEQKAQAIESYKRTFPGLLRYVDEPMSGSKLPMAQTKVSEAPQKSVAKAESSPAFNKTIWVSMHRGDDWDPNDKTTWRYGVYSLTPSDPVVLTQLTSNAEGSVAPNGAQYANGHYYGIYASRFFNTMLGFWLAQFTLSDYDTKTWTGTRKYLSTTSQQNICQESAQADDGTVYGIFWNGNMSGRELCTVDYSDGTNIKRKKIANVSNFYVALGITENDQLYGIADDGNLYKIDKKDGTETLVGPTGLTLKNSKGQVGFQTGEIDQTDDKFYWHAFDSDGNMGLYEVNLQTGAATLIGKSNSVVTGMVIPQPEPAATAPAKADTAWIEINIPDHNGKLHFKAPAQTYSGETLTGSLSYKLRDIRYKNTADSIVVSGTTTAGADVVADVYFKQSGHHKLALTVSNAAGTSKEYLLSLNVGYDTPNPVTNLKVVADSTNKQKISLSWSAPKGGANDGDYDKATLAYDVYRIANGDTVLVDEDITDTTYVDNLPVTPVTYYIYGVQAKAYNLGSDVVWMNKGMVVGNPIDFDWATNFSTIGDFGLFTIIDANKDYFTWIKNSVGYGVKSTSMVPIFNAKNDDWIITPPFKLDTKSVYTLTFYARTDEVYNANTMEVKYGKDNTVAGMENEVYATMIPPKESTKFQKEIIVSDNDVYYFGFHDNSTVADKSNIFIDSLALTKTADTEGPDSVANIRLTPDAGGALKATLTFDVPDYLIDGSTFDKADSIVITRNGKPLTVLTNKNSGESVSYTDSSIPSNAVYSYEITAYRNSKKGRASQVSGFVGKDIPLPVQNIKVSDTGNSLVVSWDALSKVGANGGYINPSEEDVSVYSTSRSNTSIYVNRLVGTSSKGGTSVTVAQNTDNTISGGTTQELYYLATRANTAEGHSDFALTNPIVLGKPIEVPFKESFKNAGLDNGFVWLEANEQSLNNSESSRWTLMTGFAADGDGGCAYWGPNGTSTAVYANDEASFNMPKVSLNGASNPKLYFSLYSTANNNAKLRVIVARPDGSETTAAEYDLTKTTVTGWTQQTVDLTQFSSERWIIVKFRGIATGSNVNVRLDNVNIFNQLRRNLTVTSIETPSKVRANKTGKLTVKVGNYGSRAERNFSIVAFVDNVPVDTLQVNDEVGIADSKAFTLNFPVGATKDKVKVKAQVVLSSDENPADDVSEANEVAVLPSEYTKVSDLQATPAVKGVSLGWTKPVTPSAVSAEDGFEDYEPFSTDLGDWTLVDDSKGLAQPLFSGYPYPGEGTAFAFEAFNPNAITSDFNVVRYNPGLGAHGGQQYAGAVFEKDAATGDNIYANNWLISPELSGNKQTIKFYALNIASGSTVCKETFDVLYSLTDTDTKSFVKLESDVADGTNLIGQGANWKEFSVEIPEGAKYFAIHHTTKAEDNFLFGIDDVSFEKAGVGSHDSVISYNIYRDGELIGSVKGTEVAYTDAVADLGQHVYNVTVVYLSKNGDVNESGLSNDASITVTGIDSIEAGSDGTYDVYTVDGKAVRLGAKSLKGLKRGVYIINNTKAIVK